MKNSFLLFLMAVIALLMPSCSDEIVSECSPRSLAPEHSSITFSFDSIVAPNVWGQYQSIEEMLAACQVPFEKLKSMSTEELIEVCLTHPLYGIYSAYNNELEGAKVVINHFNGFAELNRREDAPEKMLAIYEDVNFNPETASVHRKDFSKVRYLGFIDLYVASKELEGLYYGQNLKKLSELSNKVLEKRLKQSPDNINQIRRSLLISSQAKLVEGMLSADDEQTLKSFVEVGGNAENFQSYSKVSYIIAK